MGCKVPGKQYSPGIDNDTAPAACSTHQACAGYDDRGGHWVEGDEEVRELHVLQAQGDHTAWTVFSEGYF